MPKSKSVLKRQRQNIKRRARNRGVRSALRTYEKRTLNASTPEEASQRFRELQKELDKAASKGVIHRNTAARKKARITKQLARQMAGEAGSG